VGYKYLFGPVPSRRLGISLGVDLLPFKTCSFNCIYCECGKTTDYLIDRKEFYPIDEIFSEISDYLKSNNTPDFLTFSGSGEPTLYLKLGELIERCKKSFPDVKVKIVSSFPDVKVKQVQSFADRCGLWHVVDSFPDLKVQFVDSFPDITIKYVDSFPGL